MCIKEMTLLSWLKSENNKQCDKMKLKSFKKANDTLLRLTE